MQNNKSLEITPVAAPEVSNNNGKIITTSVAVAEYFHKRHDHVLDKIRSVMSECTPEYHLPNFREVAGGDGAIRKMPMFELTRDAFVLIVMGFTGKKALQWKIDYINAFNQMEAELQKPVSLFPFDADLFVKIRDGKTVHVQQAKEGEFFMSFESFKEIAERAGTLVIDASALKGMTIDELLKLGDTANRSAQIFAKRNNHTGVIC